MDLHAPFLARIQADADPRLSQAIYADWLEEQGDPRAELLRLAVVLQELPPAQHEPTSIYWLREQESAKRFVQLLSELDPGMWQLASSLPEVHLVGGKSWSGWYWRKPARI